MSAREILDQISLVSANFGDGQVIPDVLQDWFRFLGGKPGEVVVVDGGSDHDTQQVCWDLFTQGVIDKFQVIQSYHPENRRDACYVQEYYAGALASKPNVLFCKMDTLPFREGHDDWLAQAIGFLTRNDTFAFGGSFNLPQINHPAWEDYYFCNFCSLNFALMEHENFMAAMDEFAHDFILSGFTGENPAGQESGRYLIESAFSEYMKHHGCYTLAKTEDETWTVFHTNVHGAKLAQVREEYYARRNVTGFMNMNFDSMGERPFWRRHYGQPPPGAIRKLRIRFGYSRMGPPWRKLKKRANYLGQTLVERIQGNIKS